MNLANTPYTKEEHQEILNSFGNYISSGHILQLRAGYLDTIEKKRFGAKFIDGVSGRELYDAFASAGCFNVGRGNPQIVEALHEATKDRDMGSFKLMSKPKLDFARKLVSLTSGGLNKVILSGGGGEAIDSALKLALGATGRQEIIAMNLAYHGHSGFGLSAGGKDYYKHLFQPLMPNFRFVQLNDIDEIKKAASRDTAAIILEPIQGEGGIHVSTVEYLQTLRKSCDELGIILIFDEIQTGFGRTGKLWFYEHSGVIPDIIVLAKSISGGLFPNAAIVYKSLKILTDFVNQNPSFHSSCGGGSDLACIISSKVLDYLVENSIPENARKQGEKIKAGLRKIQNAYPKLIKEVRGKGMMLAIEYKHEFLGSMMSEALMKEGMFASFSGNAPQVMRFMLSPTLTDQETEEVLGMMNRATKTLSKTAAIMIPVSKIPFLGKLLDNEKFMVSLGNMARKEN